VVTLRSRLTASVRGASAAVDATAHREDDNVDFFEMYTAAVQSYPADYVSLEIVDVTVPGSALNVGERGSFDVRVKNAGPLRMADLRVRVKGLNGALVKDVGAAAPFVPEFVSAAGQFPLIAAHDTVDAGELTGRFGFQAPAAVQPERDLVEISLEDWTVDLAHVHESHSESAPTVKAIHRDRVRAS
jgi:hypothetical protein